MTPQPLDGIWRDQWGRLLALLVGRLRRLDLAEDALADAFEQAARRWPGEGTPANPPAWLLTVARNKALDRLRAEAMAGRKLPELAVADRHETDPEQLALVDDRLRLIFMAAHPALAPDAQAALGLRLVLGLRTDDIARLFLVPTATMAARITRAKKRIVESGIPFAVPAPARLEERIETAVRAAYLCFTAGYVPGPGADLLRADVAGEAIVLARLLDELLPGHPAVRSLLALCVLQHSRREARVRDGALVLLPDQDRSLWQYGEITDGLALLGSLIPGTGYAEELRLQAVIAGVHASAPTSADTDWASIAEVYARLEALTGSPVVRLNRAVAVAEADGPDAGLDILAGLDEALPASHRVPAVRAELLERLGRTADARAAYRQALALCRNDVESAYLASRLATLASA